MTKPVLLLLPGMLNNERLWSDVAPSLSDAARIVIPDYHGLSSIAAMATRALAQAGAGRLAVVGFSMGGYVAQEILANAPERVERIALIDTQAGPADAATAEVMAKTARAAGRDFDSVLQRMLPGSVALSRAGDTALASQLLTMWREVGAENFALQCRAVSERPDRRSTLSGTRIPALVLCGSSDMICPPQRSLEIGGLMPHARLEFLDDCGHMSPLERPGPLSLALRSWLSDR